MFNRISKYFTLNRRERNGMITIATLLIILLTVKYFIIYNYNPTTTNVNVIALDSLATELAPEKKSVKRDKDTSTTTEINLHNFDPNTISYKEAVQLSFPKKVAHILINYRNKGAKFYNAEGLKKVYGMNDALYEKLAPYVSIKK